MFVEMLRSCSYLGPIFLLFLLPFLVRPFAASLEAATNPSYVQCSYYSRCGGLPNVNISYPFRLLQSPDYCGYPGYELSCVENSLTINLEGQTYTVKNINYDDRLLEVVDSDFLGNSCPHSFTNTTINSTVFDFSVNDSNVTVYLNCSFPLLGDLVQIPCINNLFGKPNSYYKVEKGASSFLDGLKGGCDLTAVLPLFDSAANSLKISNSTFAADLQQGFGLSWVNSSPWCTDCMDSEGICGYNSTAPAAPTCHCPNSTALGSCPYYDRAGLGHFSRRKSTIIGTTASAAFSLFCISLCFYMGWQKSFYRIVTFGKKSNKEVVSIESFLKKYSSTSLKRYKYLEVKKITNSFSDKLGQGGYGAVYKGSLNDGRLVAVKILNDAKSNGEEFVNEVASIGRTSHVNVVSLLGLCSEGCRRALIYEFMSNGSLEKHIYSEELRINLGLDKLYQIAIGIARGLEYLHRGCNTRVVHFDIKPHNILLDQDFCPKISDFGLAKLCLRKDSILSVADVRGTIGFIAPEVFSRNFGVISSKSDVYSYGMLLLEMVGGRKNVKLYAEHSSEVYFPHWIHEHFHESECLREIGVTMDTEEIAKKMILVGLWCIQPMPGDRPWMSKVLTMLEGSVDDLQIPPKAFSSSP